VSLATGVSFWQQVDLWPSPSWPTVIVAFGIGFVSFCASAVIYDMLKAHKTGKLPWDDYKRPTPRRRFWTYVGIRVTVGIGCGVPAAAIALMPFLAVIAAGIAPRVALKSLGGETGDGDDGSGGGNPDKQSPRGREGESGPDA
jgi:cobalamin synthase